MEQGRPVSGLHEYTAERCRQGAGAPCWGNGFKFLPLDVVYVSPLDRAVATAAPLAAAHGLTPIQDAHFREINFGEWEGHTIAELKEKYGKAYIDFFENPFDHPVPGEGSFQNAMDRALEGFEHWQSVTRGRMSRLFRMADCCA
mgnify:CR=1 FL=1